jgi:cytochrome c556
MRELIGMKRRSIAATLGIAALAAAGLFAWQSYSGKAAADDMQAAIDARVALMKDNGAKMKAMGAVVEAKSGDLNQMAEIAAGLQVNAQKIADLFPKGTSLTDMPGKSWAKPEIWANFDDFKAAANELATEAGKLADAAKGGNLDGFAAQYDVTGEKGCGGCHTRFRQKKS